ncbi:MAG: hypothetical protein Q8R29_00895 [bacterium]|nr:hypothetical protein [bacterium]
MNLKGFETIDISGAGEGYNAYVGPTTMLEIEDLLRDDVYGIYVISSVHFSHGTGSSRSPKVNAGTKIDWDKLLIFKEHLSSLNVLLVSKGLEVDIKSLVSKALESLGNKEKEKSVAKKNIRDLKDNLVKTYMLLLKICKEAFGVLPEGAGVHEIDEELGKKIISLKEALDALYEVALRVSQGLATDDSILADMIRVERPDQAEAKDALKLAIDCMLVGYHLDKIRKYFGTDGLARLCIAALLQNAGLWGHKDSKGHEDRSARLIAMLEERGWKSPVGIKELVLNHTRGRSWSDYFVLKVKHETTIALAGGEAIKLEQVTYHKSSDWQPDSTADQGGHGIFATSVKSTNADAVVKETVSDANRLSDKDLASVIILGLVEEFNEHMDRGQILDDMVKRISQIHSIKFESWEKLQARLSVFSKVIAAIINAWRIEPIPRGSIVGFEYPGVPSAFIEQLGLDSIYLSLGVVKDGQGSCLIYLLPLKEGGKPPAGRVITINSGQAGVRNTVYQEKRQVLGVLDQLTYAQVVRNIKEKAGQQAA